MADILPYALSALVLGLIVGWFVAQRAPTVAARTERDNEAAQFKRAIADLAAAEERAEGGREALAPSSPPPAPIARPAHRQSPRWRPKAAPPRSASPTSRPPPTTWSAASRTSRNRRWARRRRRSSTVPARFRQSEEASGQGLKALLQPVHERLQSYEEGVRRVEAERRDAFGQLHGQIEAMRAGQERVSGEAAKLVNALRNAPEGARALGRAAAAQRAGKLRPRRTHRLPHGGVDRDRGRRWLRPDAIVRVPGGKSLIIDAEGVAQRLSGRVRRGGGGRAPAGATAHVASMRAHVAALGAKADRSQFDDAPDYVIMFVPGEHFLNASGAWSMIPSSGRTPSTAACCSATPTNLIAIARTVSAVWRQEKLAAQAQEIAGLGKELYARLAVMGGHVAKLGKNLDTAMGAYNAFVGSLESQVMTSARRFEALNIDTGTRTIEALPVGEQAARPLTKLSAVDEAAE
ncbi:DNA recombination protein RmuC [Sphingomonas sp. MMS24-JH45]